MIRFFQTEDADYIIESHYAIYHQEYHFDSTFREFIREGIQSFIGQANRSKESLWVLEIEGNLYGSIGITQLTDQTAQLRWFLINPSQRGNGWGRRLMAIAIEFCKEKRYEKIILWTNQRLVAARSLYQFYGFTIQEKREQFLSNQLIKEERWELDLIK